MKLTDYIIDIGRPVAYYPKLKKVTGSTTATILLCQLLYWTDKTQDGWIYKTHYDIEDETGLTIAEQRTAKKKLIELELIQKEYKRLDKITAYKVNQEVLNAHWENITGKNINLIEKESDKKEKTDSEEILNDILRAREEVQKKKEKKEKNQSAKLTEFTAKAIGIGSKEYNREVRKGEIREELEKKFGVVCDDSRWNKFIDFVVYREENFNQPVSVFINWALHNGFDPIYWTPNNMKTMYPRAFSKDARVDVPMTREEFVRTPEFEEEEDEGEYVQITKDMIRNIKTMD